jgi:IMP dehydrogenase
MTTPQFKHLRQSYGFDEVAIVPGDITLNPDQTKIDLKIGKINLGIPILASAMDGVTDVKMAIAMGKAGGLAVLNLDGVQTRYDNPDDVLTAIASASPEQVTPLMQKVYSQPIKDNLIGQRVRAIKSAGVAAAVSITPANTKKYAPMAVEAGVDILVVASTVTSARHVSKSQKGLIFSELTKSLPVPVVVGNCVSYSACLDLMKTGVAAILVGVGPGAACTSRTVLGVGVPQITATIDCAAAREEYRRESGRYIPIITDGGFRNGGDICKAIVAGADGVMLGSLFAMAHEAPGHGYHWGMANPHASLPRGTRIKVGTIAPLSQILNGPSSLTDGSQNLVGALRTCMGICGARTIGDMQKTEMVIAPSITTEGKFWQMNQKSGAKTC